MNFHVCKSSYFVNNLRDSCLKARGHLGVNQQLDQGVRHLAQRVADHEFPTAASANAELLGLVKRTSRHSAWFVALAVGLACAAFGRLLKVDWLGTLPVFLAAVIGQLARRKMLAHRVNHFICATLISFLSALLAGFGARWAGSETIPTAMIAAILLLIPGVPAVNSQNDILEGHPTLGSARAVSVVLGSTMTCSAEM